MSILTALVLLAYAITPFVRPSGQALAMQLPGFFLDLDINFGALVSIIAAAMAATGMDWLLRIHPNRLNQRTLPHMILPALTAWAIGIPLGTVLPGIAWWALFGLGSILLVVVILSEYVVVDASDSLHAPATMMLTAVSLALFLVTAIALRASGQRLYLVVPGITIGAGLVALRTLYLQKDGKWDWQKSLAVGLIIGQVGVGLHYLPISPISFGLILLGCLYALISLFGKFGEPQMSRHDWLEPVVLLVVFIGLAFAFA